MPELVTVCGRQNSGKTTWIEHLIAELQSRGLRVGTIKHTHHDYAVVGKDTTRHQDAGATRVVLASSTGCATYESWDQEPELHDLVERFFIGFDVVLAEGYRWSHARKLVVGDDDVRGPVLATLRPITEDGLPRAEVIAAATLIADLVTQPRSAT